MSSIVPNSQNTNYPKAHIYKLCCKDLDVQDIYIGSTINFRRRKSRHKNNCNNISSKEHNLYVYKFIRAYGGWENWCMILITEVNCDSKLELHQKERQHIEALKATLNIGIPARTQEEKKIYYKNYNQIYRQVNRDYIIQYKKDYYYKNKERFPFVYSPVKCECCNVIIDKTSLKRHMKSKKHIKNYEDFEKSNVATP